MTSPLSAHEKSRLGELHRLRVAEWRKSSALDEIAVLASELTGMPVSLVSLVDADEQQFAARTGLDIESTPREISFCAHAIMGATPFVVEDAQADPRFENNPLVTGVPGIRFYAGIPLETAPGLRVGTLCTIDFQPRKLSREKLRLLQGLAKVAAAILEAERAALALADEMKSRRKRERELWKVAHRDDLTGLANLKALREKAGRFLRAAEAGNACGLILVDLDHFKLVNDRLGHAAGDGYLRAVADKLRGAVRKCDFVARIGGDEFAILLPDLDNPEQAGVEILERLQTNLADLSAKSGDPALGRACIGLAFAPHHGSTLETLQKAADWALYECKRGGRNSYRVFDPGSQAAAATFAELRKDFGAAVSDGQIVPYYQPKIDLSTGKVDGFEALARWRHTTRGLLMPIDFSFALREQALSMQVYKAMLKGVLSHLKDWQGQGLSPGRVAINVSPHDLLDPDFVPKFLKQLEEAQLAPSHIIIEVTENVVMGKQRGKLYNSLSALRSAGVSVALDDFGTGYAALQHLRDWPIDSLKIDRGFISGCIENNSDRAIVAAVVQLAKTLGLGITAEGIETQQQRDLLRGLDCSLGQGYLFSRPLAPEVIPDFLHRYIDGMP